MPESKEVRISAVLGDEIDHIALLVQIPGEVRHMVRRVVFHHLLKHRDSMSTLPGLRPWPGRIQSRTQHNKRFRVLGAVEMAIW